MKRVFVRVVLRERTRRGGHVDHPVREGFELGLACMSDGSPRGPERPLSLLPDSGPGIFSCPLEDVPADPSTRLFVRFTAPNFSPSAGRLLAAGEVRAGHLPLFHPAVLPIWDSGMGDGTDLVSGDEGFRTDSSPTSPITLVVPLRRLLVVGHRGSPYKYPENTIASFRRALDDGANGLELDICCTKDKRLLVFHDPEPDAARILFEDFPYELVSPDIGRRTARILRLVGDAYLPVRSVVRWSRHTFDIARLRLPVIREYYRYRHVNGIEYPLPELGEVLDLAASRRPALELLFLDVKNPGWRGPGRKRRFLRYGRLLAQALRRVRDLPPLVVVANEEEEVLDLLRRAFREEGEERCAFCLDAAGGFLAMLGIKDDPVAAAERLGTSIVSVGARFRTGDLAEIRRATDARNRGEDIEAVLHWTINDESQMRRSLAAGVDGILTDRPELLVSILRSQGIVLASRVPHPGDPVARS